VLPVAVALAEVRGLFDLLYAAAAIPVAFVGGILALALGRRARTERERTLGRVGGRAPAAAGRLLGVLAVLLAAAGAIALATYHLIGRLAEQGIPL
jgi:hypothetical protein